MGLEMVKTIGVLLAAYNGEAYLPEQLSSLRSQDDPAFSVIMQDDGSSDRTPDVLSCLVQEDGRFRLGCESGRHLGAIGNFLSLLRQDGSDYSALCDQDDLWEPNRLSRCREALEAAEARYGAETPLLVHSDSRVMDAHGHILHESFFQHQGWDPSAVSLRRLMVQNNVTGCTMMINASLRRLIAAHAVADEMHMHDWFIAMSAAAFGHIVFLNEPLVRYRQHGDNVKGASRDTLSRRGVQALSRWQKGKARIALTYRSAEGFLRAYGNALPPSALRDVKDYLATERMGKLRRVAAVRRGGYTMQSRITRIGQLLFG